MNGRMTNGVFTWPDGSNYQGEFIDFVMSGEGILKI